MTWLINAWPHALSLLWTHVLLTVPVLVIATVIAVPLGKLASRARGGEVILAASGILYAIPALPLLVIIPAFTGLPLRSPLGVIIALTIYAMALLVRAAADAFTAIEDLVLESARAQGFSPKQLLFRVELPLATPLIIAGLRVVSVSTIGLVTIGALIGVAGLGSLLTDGFQRGIAAEVCTGIVLTVVLALIFDGLLRLAQRFFCPWEAPSGRSKKVGARAGSVEEVARVS